MDNTPRRAIRGMSPRFEPPAATKDPGMAGDEYYEVKTRIHDRLIDLIDLSLLDSLEPEALAAEIARLVEKLLREEFVQTPLNQGERERLIGEVKDEMLGLGPLEPFLKDDSVNDILVNSYRQIYVERKGKLTLTGSRFKDNSHLKKIIDRIVSRVGRRVDESAPMVDARLPDGSRVNAIIPPLAIDGPALSIRKFSKDKLTVQDLINFKAITPDIAEVLRGIVLARLNILISGGTGTGKTTMLNCLSGFIPHDERIVTVEDAAELQLKQEHVVRLESRPPNIEGRGEVTQRDLVKNCLRMRPDRIIVGEVRGAEALDMLQAMNTGHDGSLATIHANSPRDALMRLETLVAMAGLAISPLSLKRYIASAVDVIVQIARFPDGSRKLVSFQEITGMEGEVITMQEIFAFEQRGVTADARVKGVFLSRGIRPKFAAAFEAKGIKLPDTIFDPRNVVEV
ncbi:type ii/iv secretion system atp hydrolase tada/virb11/cpaf, tada subfamily [hydrocarbon metagenome]|uniref:Type ii/iv secretion system atp hydrolase tada/virb11/cpaf, tada subfamily n=1 Tax=hydrocarbon metagenome TaxID=938273 RepID=A0A0W8G930_9ZZZZ